MMHAYSEYYLSDAKKHLATAFDYAINRVGIEADLFARFFINSEYARLFECGNPRVVAGMSGYELASEIISRFYPGKKLPKKVKFSLSKSPEYWAGWALAEYQWYSARSFRDIFEHIKLSEIIKMYPIYHAMDITRFIERLDVVCSRQGTETKLKKIREANGLSQSQLADMAEVSLRSIQMYEQRKNSIDKAQVHSLFRLSKVLGCSMEDLLENPLAI